MRTPILALVALQFSCGYALVRGDASAPRVGVIADTSSEAWLGRAARDALIGRFGEAAPDAPEITGTVRVFPEEPIAIEGTAARYRVAVELIAGDGAWQRTARGEATFARGPTTAESLAARRIALRHAIERSVARWWAQWIARRSA